MQAEQPTFGPLRSPTVGSDLSHPTTVIPLFHAAWLFAFGIALAQFVWLRPSVVLIALAPLALLCGIAAFRSQRIVWLPLAVLWCLLGAWCAEMEPQPAPSREVVTLADGLLRTVEGTVTDASSIRSAQKESTDEANGEGPTSLRS
jgi:competence protein ComEC